VPAGTPDGTVQELRAAARRAAAQPVLAQALQRVGGMLDYQDGAEFQSAWEVEARRLADTVRQISKRD